MDCLAVMNRLITVLLIVLSIGNGFNSRRLARYKARMENMVMFSSVKNGYPVMDDWVMFCEYSALYCGNMTELSKRSISAIAHDMKMWSYHEGVVMNKAGEYIGYLVYGDFELRKSNNDYRTSLYHEFGRMYLDGQLDYVLSLGLELPSVMPRNLYFAVKGDEMTPYLYDDGKLVPADFDKILRENLVKTTLVDDCVELNGEVEVRFDYDAAGNCVSTSTTESSSML